MPKGKYGKSKISLHVYSKVNPRIGTWITPSMTAIRSLLEISYNQYQSLHSQGTFLLESEKILLQPATHEIVKKAKWRVADMLESMNPHIFTQNPSKERRQETSYALLTLCMQDAKWKRKSREKGRGSVGSGTTLAITPRTPKPHSRRTPGARPTPKVRQALLMFPGPPPQKTSFSLASQTNPSPHPRLAAEFSMGSQPLQNGRVLIFKVSPVRRIPGVTIHAAYIPFESLIPASFGTLTNLLAQGGLVPGTYTVHDSRGVQILHDRGLWCALVLDQGMPNPVYEIRAV